MNKSNVNLLSNVPHLEGVDSALVGDVIVKLYSAYTYNIFMSNYWALSQVAGAEIAQGSTPDLIPTDMRSIVATDCIKSAILLTQTINAFDWAGFYSQFNQTAKESGQTQRRTA